MNKGILEIYLHHGKQEKQQYDLYSIIVTSDQTKQEKKLESLDCTIFFIVGVGKTSLVHLMCQNEPTTNPSWTIGCSVDVKVRISAL